MDLINKIGIIDSHCVKCYKMGMTVYGGSKESFPHEAKKVCECGHIEKASLMDIRAARLFKENQRVHSEVVEVIENDGITCFVVPDSMIEALQLRPGDEFDFVQDGERLIAKPKINRVNN